MRQPPTVLLIEADATLARFLGEIVAAQGYRVLQAAGAEGLVLARREQPAVIVLDVPAPQAQDLLQRLKTDPATRQIPIIRLGGG